MKTDQQKVGIAMVGSEGQLKNLAMKFRSGGMTEHLLASAKIDMMDKLVSEETIIGISAHHNGMMPGDVDYQGIERTENPFAYREAQKSERLTQRVYSNPLDAHGDPMPIKTVLAAKFPLLSRRERRVMQRAISKQANKERGEQ